MRGAEKTYLEQNQRQDRHNDEEKSFSAVLFFSGHSLVLFVLLERLDAHQTLSEPIEG
jgi:hypothetical protein